VVPVVKQQKTDYMDWDRRREGYLDLPSPPVYAPVRKPVQKPADQSNLLSIRGEERVASLIAAGGVIWAVYVATVDYSSLWRLHVMPPGPVEVCGLGILAWLHAKWRRSANAG
jgi:hypothetical protein